MTVNGNGNRNRDMDESSGKCTSAIPATDWIGDNLASNSSATKALMDGTDGKESIKGTIRVATAIGHKCTSSSDFKGWRKGNSHDGLHLSEATTVSQSQSQIDDDDKNSKCSKRSNDETHTEFQNDENPRLRRRQKSKASSATSTATSTSDVMVSSLTKRLTQMTVEERQNAMYDLHGIPLYTECPTKMQQLLNEMDKSVEERLQFSKSSYADGENFGEPDLFSLLTPEQQHELMLPPKEIPTTKENNSVDDFNEGDGNSQTPVIRQRIQFLKHNLDAKDFGEGLRLAREQNPDYVYAQRIKFLRADRYNANLASARMIRFFDTKRELFCGAGYNGNDSADRSGCLGRDLRLSDFSEEDLELWRKTGLFQLCGMRDRANRPILVMFGKVIMKARIPFALIMRAYLYACNLWSRDEATQRAGVVVISYNMFTGASLPGKSTTHPSPGMDCDGTDTNADEEIVKQYMKQTYPLLSQMVKVGMSAQLRSDAMHNCIDHHMLKSQYERIAGYMATTSAARLRCHYVSTKSPESSILSTAGSRNIENAERSPSHVSTSSDHNNNVCISNSDTATDSRPNQQQNDKDILFGSTIKPHEEVLYTLMTFGIPRETIPVDDVTGEVRLELHQATLEALEKQEDLDRSLEEEARPSLSASTISSSTIAMAISADLEKQASGEKTAISLTSSTASNNLWMSLTASTGSSSSFALFPNALVDEGLEEGSDHPRTSLFGSTPTLDSESQPKTECTMPDITSSRAAPFASLSTEKSRSVSNSEISRRHLADPSALSLVPTPNDIILGRGPWNRSHPGNLQLKAMLERERDRYESGNRFERMRIVDTMLNELYHNYGARFLYKPKPEQSLASTKTDEIVGNNIWLEAERDKAHDKITHDFRNLRRQKNVPPK